MAGFRPRNPSIVVYGFMVSMVSPYETETVVRSSTTTDDCRSVVVGFVDADIKQLQDAGRDEANSRGQ